jgi:branched-chain amino acid transport system ATP-binding protein
MDLTVNALSTGYGRTVICRSVSLAVPQGRLVALVGRNGAGKTTLLRALGGALRAFDGSVTADGEDVTRWPTSRRIKHGIVYVPQELALFPGMTVEENLELGGYLHRDKQAAAKARTFVYDLFPRLAERRTQLAGTMSGGEQRMLAISRGLMAQPRLLLLDEPCTGLSPAMQDSLFVALRTVLAEGIGMLLAEQNLVRTAREANEIVIIHRGEISATRAGARDGAGGVVDDFEQIAAELARLELDVEEGVHQ